MGVAKYSSGSLHQRKILYDALMSVPPINKHHT